MVMAALAPSFGLLACGALLADAGRALLRWHVAFLVLCSCLVTNPRQAFLALRKKSASWFVWGSVV